MKCKQLYRHIQSEISEKEFLAHLEKCPQCRERSALISRTMDLLDEKVVIPSGLTRKVMNKVNSISVPVVKSFDPDKYLQLAAVVVAGILLGVLLGKNADSTLFQTRKDKELSKYIEYSHFNDENSLYRF